MQFLTVLRWQGVISQQDWTLTQNTLLENPYLDFVILWNLDDQQCRKWSSFPSGKVSLEILEKKIEKKKIRNLHLAKNIAKT